MIYIKAIKVKDPLIKVIAAANIAASIVMLLERATVLTLFYMGSDILKETDLNTVRYWIFVSYNFIYTVSYLLLGYLFLNHAKYTKHSKIKELVEKLFPKKTP
jgi:hypothetical protein